MDEIISLVVANGIFAVLFCGLLVYELKDSRAREAGYVQTIRSLSDKLGILSAVKTDTDEIKSAVDEIKTDTKTLCSTAAKRAATKESKRGGVECATATA